MIIDPGMPRKVLAKAHELDPMLHIDCLVSGGLCPKCHDTVIAAFDFFYGDCKDEGEVIAAVIKDFRQDMLDDERGTSHG